MNRKSLLPAPLEKIGEKIVVIRGQKVMLDRDLAELYGVSTKVLNQAVKRNFERFPEDFMFRLDSKEFAVLRSQIVTSKGRGGRRVPALCLHRTRRGDAIQRAE